MWTKTRLFLVTFVTCISAVMMTGCQKNDVKTYRSMEREEAKKDDRLIRESEDMVVKRAYEVELQAHKLGLSKEETKSRLQSVFDTSAQAIAACRKSGYTIPYKHDWGGREEYLKNVSLSDLMPEENEKQKKEKEIQLTLEKEVKTNKELLENGAIDEAERDKRNLESSKSALRKIKKLNNFNSDNHEMPKR